MKVRSLSALSIVRLYPRRNFWYSLLLEAESTPGPYAAGRMKSMKDPNDTIGNRTRDLPACSAVPQPTAPLLICRMYQVQPSILLESVSYTTVHRHNGTYLHPKWNGCGGNDARKMWHSCGSTYVPVSHSVFSMHRAASSFSRQQRQAVCRLCTVPGALRTSGVEIVGFCLDSLIYLRQSHGN
jgi:hypothetical protein